MSAGYKATNEKYKLNLMMTNIQCKCLHRALDPGLWIFVNNMHKVHKVNRKRQTLSIIGIIFIK